MSTTLTVEAKVNGTDYGDLGDCNETPIDEFQAVSFGAFASDHAAFDIRDIQVGTTGYGSSDLFAPVLNDLSEFTGLFGDDGSVVASGGVLSVDAASGDHYGYFTFPVAQTGTIYVQFQLRVRSGDGDPDYSDVFDDASEAASDGRQLTGIFNGGHLWSFDGCGGNFGHGPSGDPTWDTVGLSYSWTGGPPPPPATFHIAS